MIKGILILSLFIPFLFLLPENNANGAAPLRPLDLIAASNLDVLNKAEVARYCKKPKYAVGRFYHQMFTRNSIWDSPKEMRRSMRKQGYRPATCYEFLLATEDLLNNARHLVNNKCFSSLRKTNGRYPMVHWPFTQSTRGGISIHKFPRLRFGSNYDLVGCPNTIGVKLKGR